MWKSLRHVALPCVLAVTGAAACNGKGRSLDTEALAPDWPTPGSKKPRGSADRTPVSIGRVWPVAGHKMRRTKTSKTRLTLTAGPETEVDEEQHRDEEVLATKDGIITQLRMRFEDDRSTQKTFGVSKKEASVLDGNVYVVSVSSAGIVVASDSAKPASPAESARIIERFPGLGRRDFFLDAMPKSVVPGERVPPLEQAMAMELNTVLRDRTVEDVVVRFVGAERNGTSAVFDVSWTLTINEKLPAVTTIDFHGQWRVRTKDGWETELWLEGPVTVVPAGAPAPGGSAAPSVLAKGSMTLRSVTEFP